MPLKTNAEMQKQTFAYTGANATLRGYVGKTLQVALSEEIKRLSILDANAQATEISEVTAKSQYQFTDTQKAQKWDIAFILNNGSAMNSDFSSREFDDKNLITCINKIKLGLKAYHTITGLKPIVIVTTSLFKANGDGKLTLLAVDNLLCIQSSDLQSWYKTYNADWGTWGVASNTTNDTYKIDDILSINVTAFRQVGPQLLNKTGSEPSFDPNATTIAGWFSTGNNTVDASTLVYSIW